MRSRSLRVAAALAIGSLTVGGLATLGATATSAPAQAETSSAGVPIFQDNTFYAYVEAGETLDLSFTKAYANDNATAQVFTAVAPDGTTAWTCTIAANAALGQSCATTGLTSTTTGAWKITANRAAVVAGPSGYDWNVTVRDGGAAQTGRVWSTQYTVIQSNGQFPDLTYYLVNDTGYQYTTSLRGYNGIGSVIQANSVGNTTADCAPTYQSKDGGLSAACGENFRIFFQQPSAALPATATSADGTLTVVPAPLTIDDLAVDDLAFEPASTNAADGTFTYSIDPRFQGGYQLQIDTNGNGSYDDDVDRTIQLGADGSGEYSYDFDGVDGQGNPIADCTLMNARIFYDKVGEIHVLQQDVEGRTGGIQITRTNGAGAPSNTIYWDDTNLSTDGRVSTTPVLDGTAGVNSAGGVHGWGSGTNSWGDARTIDDWTYVPLDQGTGEIAVGGRCLEITKTADTDEVVPGDTITYTVTLENTGDVDYTDETPAAFTDDMSEVLDDASYNDDVTGGASYTEPDLTWSGPLAAGDTRTFTYSVTVNDPITGDGRLTNAVTSTTPGVNCPVGSTDPACIVELPTRAFVFSKTASATEAAPGDPVTYTVTVRNIGIVDYTDDNPAGFTDDLSAVLDDATYNGDASNGATVTGNTLAWSGPLAAGATETITYTVTINTPDTGDKTLTNVVTTPDGITGGSCDPDGSCTTTTTVRTFTVTKTSSPDGPVQQGDQVTYQVTVKSTGTAPFTEGDPAGFTDDLSAVLDDATITGAPTNGATIDGNTLTWSGALGVDDAITITYVATVNTPDTGDHVLRNAVVPVGPGECDPEGSCTTTNEVRSFTVEKTASTGPVHPGEEVTYTVTVTNTGAVAYSADEPASFDDNMSEVLDDATYVDGSATNGATVSGTTLSWAGPLPVDGTETITYRVLAGPAGTGDGTLTNTVVPGDGGYCDPEDSCTTTTLLQAYTVTKTADTTSVVPGDTVTYTVTVRNTGTDPYTDASPASFTDDLSEVLDDATYNGDASDGATYEAPTLSWSGPLAVGATETITYSVTVNDPDTGDQHLDNTVVTPPNTGSNCEVDSDDAACTVNIPSGSYTVAKTSDRQTVKAGDKVTYTVTVTNTGDTAYTTEKPASFRDDLTNVLDDATYNKDATQGATVNGNTLTWSGPLAVGQTVKVTYSVTVNNPVTGNLTLVNAVTPTSTGGSCDTDGTCMTSTPVKAFTVTKTVSTTEAVKPGDVVRYTVTVTNTGAVAFTAADPASFTDDMSDVLDDATYNDDASNGTVLQGTTLNWSGPLEVGAATAVKYSVTVKPLGSGNGALVNTVDPPVDGACDPAGSCQTETPIAGAPTPLIPGVPGLAFTGTELIGPGIGLALLLLALGGTVLVIRRRKQSSFQGDDA